MANEVATRSRTELANESAYDPFAQAGQDMAGASALYAKFNGNSGEFTYGAQAVEVEKGERMAANVYGARRGHICWVESEVAEEIMVPLMQGPPPATHTLTDHGPYKKYEDGTQDGWSEQFSIEFRLLGEDHDGVEITYKTSTKSAMRPLGDLVKQFGREYKSHPGCVPIVEFGKGDYMPKEKKHGKKYFPTFKIVDWIDEETLLAQYGDDSKVAEGETNDNLIEAPKAKAEKPATAKKETAPKKTKAETKAAEAPAEVAADEDEDPEIAAMLAAVAAKKAAKAKAAAAPAEKSEAEKKAEALAAKKAALAAQLAAMEAEEGDEAGEEVDADGSAEDGADDVPLQAAQVAEDKPAPAATRTRRRSF